MASSQRGDNCSGGSSGGSSAGVCAELQAVRRGRSEITNADRSVSFRSSPGHDVYDLPLGQLTPIHRVSSPPISKDMETKMNCEYLKQLYNIGPNDIYEEIEQISKEVELLPKFNIQSGFQNNFENWLKYVRPPIVSYTESFQFEFEKFLEILEAHKKAQLKWL